MSRYENRWTTESDGNEVRFGPVRIEVKIRRKHDIRAGKDLGNVVDICIGLTSAESSHIDVPLQPPGEPLDEERAKEIETGIAFLLEPVCARFLSELREALTLGAQVSADRLRERKEKP